MTYENDGFNPFVPGAARSVSMAQAASVLGISRRTLYYWIRDGRLSTIRTPMGSQRVLTDSIRSNWYARR